MLIFICLFRPLGLFITRRVTEKGPTRTTKAATVARPSRSRDWSVSLSSSNSGTRGTRWWPMLTWIIHTFNWPTSPPSAGHSASTIGVVGNAPTHRPSAAIKIHFQHFPSYWWQPLRAAHLLWHTFVSNWQPPGSNATRPDTLPIEPFTA